MQITDEMFAAAYKAWTKDPNEGVFSSLRSAITAALTAAPKPEPVADAGRIANAIEACDWSGTSIGNKEILKAAVAALRVAPPAADRDAEIEQLRELVKDAFFEGFQEGKDGGWVCGPVIPWRDSDATKQARSLREIRGDA